MAMENMDGNDTLAKVKQYGSTGLLVAGAFALVSFLRSQGGRERVNTLLGGQFSGVEDQIKAGILQNWEVIEESIDTLVQQVQQGVTSLGKEVDKYADDVKHRIHEYATAPALPATTTTTTQD